MEIRRLAPKDVGPVCALEEEIFSDPWSESSVVSAISTVGGMCYGAFEGGQAVAYLLARVIAPEGEIYRIATAPFARRRGIAYRLLDYAVKCEKGRGLECLFLEVRSRNIPARNLYRAYGFKEVGERKNYYSNPTDDAVIMLRAHSQDMIN
jgi:ribosomal-protein-alanine N-acetyltransferase